MKKLVFAIALVISGTAASAADKLSLNKISTYLNGLKTAQSSFTQINGDGTLSTGRLLIKRPGRMRFEYNPPDGTLVVAGAGAVVVVDQKSNQPPESYPLQRTPLSIIMAKNVNLGRANMVVGHGFDGTTTIVTAQDPEHPEHGRIDMMFTGNPVELRKWVVHDSAGEQTTVILGELKKGGSLSDGLFDVQELGNQANR